MAKNKDKRGKKDAEMEPGFFTPTLKEETKHGVISVICLVLAFFFLLASWHGAGAAGDTTYNALYRLFGTGFFIIPLSLVLLGISFARSIKPNLMSLRLIAGLIFFLAALALVGFLAPSPDSTLVNAGFLGRLIASPLNKFFGFYSLIFLLGVMLVSLFIIFDSTLTLPSQLSPTYWWQRWRLGKQKAGEAEVIIAGPLTGLPPTPPPAMPPSDEEGSPKIASTKTPEPVKEEDWSKMFSFGKGGAATKFTPPPLSLLEADSGKPAAGDIKSNANIIKRTLGRRDYRVGTRETR
jgi:hypothetical protein